MQSTRAQVVRLSRYARPLENGRRETHSESIDRVISHQRWLWERAQGMSLSIYQEEELEELRKLHLTFKASLAGRTLWLGGTKISQTRESSMFNCSGLVVSTVHDAVDAFWLLLQGCGVGFRGNPGCLSGFSTPIKELEVIRSTRTDKGREGNIETWDGSTWTISVGDSAEAWAKSLGKLFAGKYPGCKKLVLDFSQVRPAGYVLKGYGWVSSGDTLIASAYTEIFKILNRRPDALLTFLDIHHILNLIGSVLSSRRSAEISLCYYGDTEWEEFAHLKDQYWLRGQSWLSQSNNTLIFRDEPSLDVIESILRTADKCGGDPGILNEKAALRRAPWFKTVNPCAEILLPDKGFCNLVDVNINAFESEDELLRAIYIMGRANYRQTCVNLDDGILQKAWHQNNYFLRLCGVGLTGITQRPDRMQHLGMYRAIAHNACYSMAMELRLPLPKNITTVKPSGTLSKMMDCTEGMHKPIGKYIFNNIQFSAHDPAVATLRKAGYYVFSHPHDPTSVLIRFPVESQGVEFEIVDGKEVNLESAVSQLNRYQLLMTKYCDQNVSSTISYSPEEIPDIAKWIKANWNNGYVACSFLRRTDPIKTAADLGHPYLPQEVVTKEQYDAYTSLLRPVDLSVSDAEVDECVRGACPTR